MGYGDYYWGLYRTTIFRDPFPHSLLKVLMAVQNPTSQVVGALTRWSYSEA